jgi:hypothetical protein
VGRDRRKFDARKRILGESARSTKFQVICFDEVPSYLRREQITSEGRSRLTAFDDWSAANAIAKNPGVEYKLNARVRDIAPRSIISNTNFLTTSGNGLARPDAFAVTQNLQGLE